MFDYKFDRKRHTNGLFKLRRVAFLAAVISIALFVYACAPRQSSVNSETQANATTTTNTTQTSSQSASTQTQESAPPIVSAHGGAIPPMSSGVGGASADKTDMDTSALDAKIAQAERKAKAPNATDADKRIAAAAYLERGHMFYNAQQPSLYKFALRDLRKVLRYEPDNADAREKVDTIVAIYQSMNRPVPELGNEP